jgi:hypothetical protein
LQGHEQHDFCCELPGATCIITIARKTRDPIRDICSIEINTVMKRLKKRRSLIAKEGLVGGVKPGNARLG